MFSNNSSKCCRPGHQKAHGALKLTRFQINTKSIKAYMMNISVESLSLIEDMVSEVIILRNSFYFPWQSVKNKDKALLLMKDYSRNITINVLSKSTQLLGSKNFPIISICKL